MGIISNYPPLKKYWQLFLLAFMEGASVMAVELLGAKMIAPYFGSSLVVWTSVIGITLASLTVGYYLGGNLSTKPNLKKTLFILLSLASIWIAMMPVISHGVLNFIMERELDWVGGSLAGSILLFSTPLILLGSSTPIIIRLTTDNVGQAGKNSGIVYGVSTIGGIIMTFVMGFAVIPAFGISVPIVVVSVLMIGFTFALLYEKKVSTMMIVLGVIFCVAAFNSSFQKVVKSSKSFTILDESEGLMGQLRVVDESFPEQDFDDRYLMINGIPQTFIVAYDNESYWYYVHMISVLSTMYEPGSDVLLLGFGGGSVADELDRSGFKIDAVEIDERMLGLAKKHFYFDDSRTNFIVDDARHYLRTAEKQYDIVIFDMISGEVQPPHVFSMESFEELKGLLKPDALVIVNFQCWLEGKEGYAFRSMFKTFQEAGFKHTAYTVDGCAANSPCDIIIVASMEPIDLQKINIDRVHDCCYSQQAVVDVLNNRKLLTEYDSEDAEVFYDDRPRLEVINQKAIRDWRSAMTEFVAEKELEEGLKLFK